MGTNARKRQLFIKQVILLLVLAAAAWAGFQVLGQILDDRARIAIQFELPEGGTTPEYRVRIANSESERRQGLMYVKEKALADGKGMIFVFPTEVVQNFWMKNTPAPLDMIFINKKQEVVGIVENAKPFSVEIRNVDAPSVYVVELLAGTSARDGIKKGAKLITAAPIPLPE